MSKAVGCNGRLATATLMVLVLVASIAGAAAGRDLVVTSTADAGAGTLRWALQTARSGDVLTFDPSVFPPHAPATISLRSELPPIERPRARITIDASDAGVILDGSGVPGEWSNGLQIYTDDCAVMGLRIVGFTGSGITACGGSRNRIGGDPDLGAGPTGQGNLVASNVIGIDLCGGGSGNTIAGNIIGTDLSGSTAWGNRVFNISIEDGVVRTTIGPGNVIGRSGTGVAIDIDGSRATGNTVTENVFLRGDALPIHLGSGANGRVASPSIQRVDLATGIVGGSACPRCTVEVFIREGDRLIPVGSATADDDGAFLLSSRDLTRGDAVGATVTDAGGNTSQLVTASPTAVGGMQIEASASLRPYLAASFHGLLDNRIGAHFCGLSHPYYYPDVFADAMIGLGDLADLGVKHVRFAINDLDWATIEWDEPELTVAPRYDAFVDSLVGAGIELTYVLTFWDKAWVAQGNRLPSPRFETEAEISRYLEFVRLVVSHFRGRIRSYEIWNEPTSPASIQSIDVEDYLELVRRAAPVIREEDPNAWIVVGGTTYPFFAKEAAERDYAFRILQSDVMPLVDVVSWHGMYGTSPAHAYHREYYIEYPEIVAEMKNAATAAGFSGTFVADELNWQTSDQVNPDADWPNSYSEPVCAKYYARGILMNLAMDHRVSIVLRWQKPLWFATIRNLCTAMAGHEAIDLTVDIDIETDGPVAHCAFRHPNGDRMLAIWTDGVAQDKDPGVPATIRFPGLAAGGVVGIDVLRGVEQELVFETDDGDTIVRDLLVKDYPILIRLSDIAFRPNYEETVGDGFHRLGEPNGGSGVDRDRDGIPDDEDFCPDWPGSEDLNGC